MSAIRGAKVWHRGTFIETSISFSNGKIIEISKKAHEAADGVVRAEGKHLIPGLVDLHVHTRDPGYTHKEDFVTATKAAAAGGVTTIADMPNLNPPPNTARIYMEKMEDSRSKAVVDFNHYALPTKLEEIPKIANLGAIGFKFFMVVHEGKPVYPHMPEYSIVDYGQILQTLEQVAKTGLPCVVHPREPEIWRVGEKEIKEKEGKSDIDAYLDCHSYRNSLTLTTSSAMLILIANSCGAKLTLAHACWRPQLELLRVLKSSGYKFAAEINPWAFFFSREDNKRPGLYSHGLYHRGEEQDSIYEFLKDGTVDIIATDHAPNTVQEMEQGRKDFFTSPRGSPVLQDYLRLFLDSVNKGNLTLEDFVRLACENPAKCGQIYPKKGTIEVGSDADLVLLDMKKEYKISNDKAYSKSGWTPWDKVTVKGTQEKVFLRGNLITEECDVVLGTPGDGEFVRPLK